MQAADPNDELDALVDQVLDRAPRPTDWARVPAHEAPMQWAALDAWVRWLVRRYTLDHRDVPPCWYRHGALVQELTALRDAHAGAYHPAQPLGGPADWHQTLGYTRLRCRDWVARTGCKPGEHRD